MDTQLAEHPSKEAIPDSEELTFNWLYHHVQRYVKHSIYPSPSRLELWSFRGGLAAAAVGVLISQLAGWAISSTVALPIVLACLLLEVAGFLIAIVLMAKRELRQFTQPRRSHAQEMDAEFSFRREVVHLLQAFSREEREERLRYVSTLRTNMIDRMGMMYGGIQKLGPFPILIALYLQFRHWKPGDWSSVLDVGFVSAVMIFAMVVLCAIGWFLIAIRTRLDTYIDLLEASLHSREGEKPSVPAPPAV